MMKERIGLFGGTFSPPHNGHVYAVKTFAERVQPDKILIMPTAIPPHKVKMSCDTASERLEMCRAAFEDIDIAEVSDYEIRRGGISYTVNTLEYLSESDREIFLLCGTDMFLTLCSWYRAERIFELANIICVPRSAETVSELELAAEKYCQNYNARVQIIDADPLEISSTEVRAGIERGQVDRRLIPAKVADIIERYGLYKNG